MNKWWQGDTESIFKPPQRAKKFPQVRTPDLNSNYCVKLKRVWLGRWDYEKKIFIKSFRTRLRLAQFKHHERRHEKAWLQGIIVCTEILITFHHAQPLHQNQTAIKCKLLSRLNLNFFSHARACVSIERPSLLKRFLSQGQTSWNCFLN